jgi:cbb3-type cytochrome oxidase maturation protein
MSVFLILIPVSLGLAVAFLLMCLASIKSGQFDDLESPRWRILFERPARMTDVSPSQPAIPVRKPHDER